MCSKRQNGSIFLLVRCLTLVPTLPLKITMNASYNLVKEPNTTEIVLSADFRAKSVIKFDIWP